ncbi:MAG: carbon-nitrogen hydrolase family protein [Candidatus Odinarchaeia archaeon]
MAQSVDKVAKQINNELTVVIHQLHSKPEQKEENTQRLIKLIKNKTRGTHTLHIFPELFISGYPINKKFLRLAEPIPGPTINKLIPHIDDNTTVVFGMPEKSKLTNKIFNTAIVMNKNGVISKYRKISLPQFWLFKEKEFFKPGSEIPLFNIKGVPMGIQICYDINFPEISRYQALNGAKVLIIISATPVKSIPRFKTLLKARAIENQVFVIYANTVGKQNGILFGGNSLIIGPNGRKIRELGKNEETSVTQLKLSIVEETREITPLLLDAKHIIERINVRY